MIRRAAVVPLVVLAVAGCSAGTGQPAPSDLAPQGVGTSNGPPDGRAPGVPGSPDPRSHGAGSPGAGSPGAGSPGAGSPGAGSPGAGSPGAGLPGAGSPGAGSPGAGSPGAGSPPALAPAVADPRDGSGLHGCAGPTARLAPDLVSAASATPAGDGCLWTDPPSTAVLRADVRVAGGLDALYRAAGQLRAFRTGELSGSPTVVTTPPDDPSCSLHVGLSGGPGGEVLTVQVGPAGAPVRDPCRVATTAAARLLAAMPPARRTPGGPP